MRGGQALSRFFDRETLVAVLDLIERYPQDDTAYIGFFMTKKERQGYGLGSTFIGELMDELRREKFCKVRLAVDRAIRRVKRSGKRTALR